MGIPQVLSLACYAMGVFRPQQDRALRFRESESLPDTLQSRSPQRRVGIRRGLLHGNRDEETHFRRSGGGSGSRSRCGVDSGSGCRSRFDTTSSKTTSLRTAGEGRGHPAERDAPALAEGASRIELGPRECSSRSRRPSMAERCPRDPLRPAQRALPARSRARPARSAAQRIPVRPRERACVGIPDEHEPLFEEFVTVALREGARVSEQTLLSNKGLTTRRGRSGRHQTRPCRGGMARSAPRRRCQVQEPDR